MSQYGKAAVLATQFYREGKATSPEDAWAMAAQQKIPNETSRKKPCPRGAYLSLCDAGLLHGVPPDCVVHKSQEKKYVTTAVDILKQDSRKTENLTALWREVLTVLVAKAETYPGRNHQGEMNVVVALWKNGDIIR